MLYIFLGIILHTFCNDFKLLITVSSIWIKVLVEYTKNKSLKM